ncbi:hypothetical protein BDN70DRAFT_936334 [Pholiota conissans]|uniref:Uncharacterized protein n=1 Tax=Pholiota conissans TaxID=109636 RepID=A0A9P5YSY2_9AGAR|nr:hypothetical protein BDN70DRAFT_936334 [Pholiota conissans]
MRIERTEVLNEPSLHSSAVLLTPSVAPTARPFIRPARPSQAYQPSISSQVQTFKFKLKLKPHHLTIAVHIARRLSSFFIDIVVDSWGHLSTPPSWMRAATRTYRSTACPSSASLHHNRRSIHLSSPSLASARLLALSHALPIRGNDVVD